MATAGSPRRYAEAAFEIALRDGTLGAWHSDLGRCDRAFGDPRVAHVARDPALPMQARLEVIERVGGAPLSGPVRNLILLLLQRRRIEFLPRVVAEFQRLVDRRDGVTRASVTAAAALTGDERGALRERLSRMTGGEVVMTETIDPDLLGGVVVRLGDRMIDGSVRGRLQRLRSQLISGAL
jgi:F-type H+-transporting ATPase subunit delta